MVGKSKIKLSPTYLIFSKLWFHDKTWINGVYLSASVGVGVVVVGVVVVVVVVVGVVVVVVVVVVVSTASVGQHNFGTLNPPELPNPQTNELPINLGNVFGTGFRKLDNNCKNGEQRL